MDLHIQFAYALIVEEKRFDGWQGLHDRFAKRRSGCLPPQTPACVEFDYEAAMQDLDGDQVVLLPAEVQYVRFAGLFSHPRLELPKQTQHCGSRRHRFGSAATSQLSQMIEPL